MARGVRWVALAVAALVVLVALFVGRSVRSAGEWLRQSWEGRRSEAKKKKVAQDEEYLARLSSAVEKPKIEPPVSDEARRR